MVSELDAQLLLNLANALLGDAEGLGASLVIAGQASNHATTENLRVCGLEGGREGLQGAGDVLAVLGALHGDVLTQRGVGDDATDGSTVLVADGLVDADTARGHRREAGAHVVDVELQVGRDGLGAGVRAESLLGFLEASPELLRRARAAVEQASVGLDVLLTLGAHPLLGVRGEAGTAANLVLASGVYDALASLREQVIEGHAVANVLLGDLHGEAHVGAHEVVRRLSALVIGGGRVLCDGDASNLLGLAEDDGGRGEGREKGRHVGISGCC